jgi:hypothetical protein
MILKGVPTAMKKNMKKTTPAIRSPMLRFSPTAWAKLLFLRDEGETEIGGFGISAREDLLLVEDVVLVAQECTWSHVAFNDESVADFFDRQVEAGRRPEEFGRIWVHTHPGDSPEPSGTDEESFARVFGRADWALMFILARGGQTYARLRYNSGPGVDVKLPAEVEFCRTFAGSDFDRWRDEYVANVRAPEAIDTKVELRNGINGHGSRDHFINYWRDRDWEEYYDLAPYLMEGEHGFIPDF